MVGNTIKVLRDALVRIGDQGQARAGDVASALDILNVLVTDELVDAISRAAIRDRLGVDPDFEQGARSTST